MAHGWHSSRKCIVPLIYAVAMCYAELYIIASGGHRIVHAVADLHNRQRPHMFNVPQPLRVKRLQKHTDASTRKMCASKLTHCSRTGRPA
eukprot:scaffold1261_cov18-Tisochrysis_lutea.AAC.5